MKLNKKGFTLIELLAVIVVLAIVMVIATTTILNSTRNAAKNSFVQSANMIVDFVKKQEQLYAIDPSGSNMESCYYKWRTTIGKDINNTYDGAGNAYRFMFGLQGNDMYACYGINKNDYDLTQSVINFKSNGEIEVYLAPSSDGKFSNITDAELETTNPNEVCNGEADESMGGCDSACAPVNIHNVQIGEDEGNTEEVGFMPMPIIYYPADTDNIVLNSYCIVPTGVSGAEVYYFAAYAKK